MPCGVTCGFVPTDLPVPRVLAHRGANRVAPENTLEAFALAGALGADGVELDVHRTADGALVPRGAEIAAVPVEPAR